MTFFGVIWLLVMFYAFVKNNIKWMLYLCLFSMTLQSTNVIVLESLGGIGPQIITSGIFVIKAILLELKNGKLHIVKGQFLIVQFFILALFIEVIWSTQINDALDISQNYIIQLFIYIMCFLTISNIFMPSNVNSYSLIRSIIVVITIIGIIQWLTTNNMLPLRSIMEILIYNDSGESVAFTGNVSRLYSTFMEPSYYAGFIVGSFYYLLSITNRWKKNCFLMIVILIELFLSTSSTGYIAFLIVGIIFIVLSKKVNIKNKIFLILTGLICFIFVFIFAYNTLDEVIFSKSQTGSAETRSALDIYAIDAFENSPIWGNGYKIIRGSSIVTSLLGQIGIVGLILYLAMNFALVRYLLKVNVGNEKFRESQGIAYALLSCFLCEIISCPDLDLCTYWFWVYCSGLYIRKYSVNRSRYVISNNIK